VFQFGLEAHHIQRTLMLSHDNKNIQLVLVITCDVHIYTSLEFEDAKRLLIRTHDRFPRQMI
jgi:hypothetical protein